MKPPVRRSSPGPASPSSLALAVIGSTNKGPVRMMARFRASLLGILWLFTGHEGVAAPSDGGCVLHTKPGGKEVPCNLATFGAWLPDRASDLELMVPSGSEAYACDEISTSLQSPGVILAIRGRCSFLQKAITAANQQLITQLRSQSKI